MAMVKTSQELLAIITASAMNDTCFQHILEYLRPGLSEIEIADEIYKFLKKLGAEDLAFPTIAVAGKNGANPHGIPSDYKIQEGDFLTLDFGAVIDGYCGDFTRTLAIGRATPFMKKIYNIVRAAQEAAIDACFHGANLRDVDGAARSIIESAGYGKYFIHGTGHGVGKEVHEEPYINTKATDQEFLSENMAVTIEPGIYIPGKLGVRIEDLVVITSFGVINTNNSSKDLCIIK